MKAETNEIPVPGEKLKGFNSENPM